MRCFLASFVTVIGCVIAVPQLPDIIKSYNLETPGEPTYQVRSSKSGFNIHTSNAARGINSQSASHSSSLATQSQSGSGFGLQTDSGLGVPPFAQRYSQPIPLAVNSQSEFGRESAITSSKSSGTKTHSLHGSQTGYGFNGQSSVSKTSVSDFGNQAGLGSQFGSRFVTHSAASPATKTSTNFDSQPVGSFGSQSLQVADASGFNRKSNVGSFSRPTFGNYHSTSVGSQIDNTQVLHFSNFGRKAESQIGSHSPSKQSVVSNSNAQNSYVSQADFGTQSGSNYEINSAPNYDIRSSAAHETDSLFVFGGQPGSLINADSIGPISSKSAFTQESISGFGSQANHKSAAGSNAQSVESLQSNFGVQSGRKTFRTSPSGSEFHTVGVRKSPVGFVTQTVHGSQSGSGPQSSSTLGVHSGSTVIDQSNTAHKFGLGGHSGPTNDPQSAFAHNSEGSFGTKSVHQASSSQFGSTFNAHGGQSGSTFRDQSAGSGFNFQKDNRNQSPFGVQSIDGISNQAIKSQNYGKSFGIQSGRDALSTISQSGSSVGTQSIGVTSSESATFQKYSSGSNLHLAQGAQSSGIIAGHTGTVHNSAGFGAHETHGTQSHSKFGTQSSGVTGSQSTNVNFGGQSGSAFGAQSSSITSSESTTSQKFNTGLNSHSSQGFQSNGLVNGHSGIIHNSGVAGTQAAHGSQFNSNFQTQSRGVTGSQSTTTGFGSHSNHGFQSRSAFGPQSSNTFGVHSEGTNQGSINRAAGDASFRHMRGSAFHNSHILSQFQDQTNDGSKFTYGYETEDGTRVNGAGVIKDIGTVNENQQVTGSYSYIGDDGKTYTVNYTADDGGFHPQGSHIPQMSEEIARSIEYNLAHPEEYIQEDVTQHQKIEHH